MKSTNERITRYPSTSHTSNSNILKRLPGEYTQEYVDYVCDDLIEKYTILQKDMIPLKKLETLWEMTEEINSFKKQNKNLEVDGYLKTCKEMYNDVERKMLKTYKFLKPARPSIRADITSCFGEAPRAAASF